jgi:DNA polymerase-1
MCMAPRGLSAADYQRMILAPVGEVVIGMERTGIPVDLEALRDIEAQMAARSVELRAELASWAPPDINWNSWQQIAAFFHDPPEQGGLGMEPSPYCKKGEVPDDKISTDDRALEWLAGHNPEHREPIQKLRTLRTVERMGRYARDWLASALLYPDGTWRLHPTFGLASDYDTRPGAVTGRFGVKNPALNQVPSNTDAVGDLGLPKDPAGMKKAFVPPPGCKLIVVDYSQLEIVILAHLIAVLFGEDDPLVKKVRAGEDIHGPLARYVFGVLAKETEIALKDVAAFKKEPLLKMLRNLAKAGIYGNNYGKGEQGFATSVFLPTGEPLGPERAHFLKVGLNEFYPGIARYQQYIREFIERYAYIVTLLGRWQPQPNAKAQRQGDRNRAWRQSLNYPMQGGGQEIMCLALIAIANDPRLRELGFVLSLVVHDEIVGWAPEEHADECLKLVEHHMVHAMDLLVPLKAEGKTGKNWKEAK